MLDKDPNADINLYVKKLNMLEQQPNINGSINALYRIYEYMDINTPAQNPKHIGQEKSSPKKDDLLSINSLNLSNNPD